MSAPVLPTRPPLSVAPEISRKVVARQEDQLAKQLALRPWTAASSDAAQRIALDTAAQRAAIDPADPEIARDLEAAACASAALFAALAAGPGTDVEAPLPGSDASVVVAGAAPGRGDPIDWRTGLLAALASRKRRAIEMLAGIPIAVLTKLAPRDPAWQAHEREALAAFAVLRAGAGDLLAAAAVAADPATVDPRLRDWVLDIVSPELQLAFSALVREPARFDQWMVEAIKGHHHYYFGRLGAHPTVQGQLALAPLAMACVARDLGVHTTIASDYVPASVIG